jgi:hypothetical protein
MTRLRRASGNLAAALAGALAGGLLVLAADGLTRPTRGGPDRSGPATAAIPAELAGPRGPTTLLVWAPGGLPARAERVIEGTDGVLDATTVRARLEWLRSSRLADGAQVDDPPAGMSVPIDSAVIEPGEYARFVPPGDRAAILGLTRSTGVLAATAARLRGASDGLRMRLGDRRVDVTGTVSDVAANGFELLLAESAPAHGGRVTAYVLAHIRRGARPAVAGRVEDLLGHRTFTTKALGEAPFLRQGDAVLPQMLVKETFGEFAARPLPDGTLEIDPSWRRRNVETVTVPVLGEVTCHRALVPQLRAALRQAVAEGLAYTLDGGYGGCYFARFIDYDPRGWLSRHAWGVAIDLNVSENLHGTKPDQDDRLVRLLESYGFSWGGGWIVPDGMHFEFLRFP